MGRSGGPMCNATLERRWRHFHAGAWERSNIGGFTNDPYWSSSEHNEYHLLAWYQGMGSSSQGFNPKMFHYSVRAVRAF